MWSVVEQPVDGQLDQVPRRVAALHEVRRVVAHQAAVVLEVVLGQQVQRDRAQLPAGGTVADRGLTR